MESSREVRWDSLMKKKKRRTIDGGDSLSLFQERESVRRRGESRVVFVIIIIIHEIEQYSATFLSSWTHRKLFGVDLLLNVLLRNFCIWLNFCRYNFLSVFLWLAHARLYFVCLFLVQQVRELKKITNLIY